MAEVLLDYFACLKDIRDRHKHKLAVEALLQQHSLWKARKRSLGGDSGGLR